MWYVIYTRRYGQLRGPTSSSGGGLQPRLFCPSHDEQKSWNWFKQIYAYTWMPKIWSTHIWIYSDVQKLIKQILKKKMDAQEGANIQIYAGGRKATNMNMSNIGRCIIIKIIDQCNIILKNQNRQSLLRSCLNWSSVVTIW